MCRDRHRCVQVGMVRDERKELVILLYHAPFHYIEAKSINEHGARCFIAKHSDQNIQVDPSSSNLFPQLWGYLCA